MVITGKEIKSLSAQEKKHLDKIRKDRYEIIKPPFCYINHSCEPNVKEKHRIGYAARDIEKGEELSLDYDIMAYLERPFRCRCGSKSCRKYIHGTAEE